MKNRLSHIFRSATITLLMSGFVAHMFVPYSSNAQKAAFTKWLDHNVVATGDETEAKLRNAIRQLPEQTRDFHLLVQEATRLVVDHKKDFRLQVSLPENTEPHSPSWLIGQWNSFQDHQTGKNALVPEFFNSALKWIPVTSSPAGYSVPAAVSLQSLQLYGSTIYKTAFKNIAIEPLLSGISINAP